MTEKQNESTSKKPKKENKSKKPKTTEEVYADALKKLRKR